MGIGHSRDPAIPSQQRNQVMHSHYGSMGIQHLQQMSITVIDYVIDVALMRSGLPRIEQVTTQTHSEARTVRSAAEKSPGGWNILFGFEPPICRSAQSPYQAVRVDLHAGPFVFFEVPKDPDRKHGFPLPRFRCASAWGITVSGMRAEKHQTGHFS
jgi:hypothetical protein